jgi:hypothetical protein
MRSTTREADFVNPEKKDNAMIAGGELRPFVRVLVLLVAAYTLWLVSFWPGVLGEDSLAILLEVQTQGEFRSGKPVFWYLFVKALFEPTLRVEAPIAVQLLLAALVFSRILGWCWARGLKKTFAFLLVFVCLAPHMIFFAGSLYPDGVFSVAVSGLLFELWLVVQSRKLSTASLLMCSILLPFAVFARANGLIFLAPVLYTTVVLKGSDRLKLLAVGFTWCAVVFIGGKVHGAESHDTLYPLALFETVNFLQPRPMNLWQERPRISEKTLQSLTRQQPVQKILENYDRDYWDPLIQKPDGPRLNSLSRSDKRTIVKEFFRYNLWQNMPAFLASRVNIFMVSALAQGGMVSIEYTSHVLPQIKTASEFRRFQLHSLTSALNSVHEFGMRYRWLLWTPWVGIALLFMMLRRGMRAKDGPMLMIAIPMAIQLLAIFVFSIAGEYRYLLPFFTLPLVALPVLATASRRQP